VRGVIGQLGSQLGTGGTSTARTITVVDMEASLEHLSRGTLRHCDVLLITVEPYFRALETAGRTARYARELGIPHVYSVANKVRTPADERAIRDYCAAQQLPVLVVVPFDEQVTEADRAGGAVLDEAPAGAAVAAIARLAAALRATWAPTPAAP
jgi:CO dehydrogenase maturation factor